MMDFGFSGPFAPPLPARAAFAIAKLIAPFASMSATSGESNRGASIANFTSLPPVERMSVASYQLFHANTVQYIGIASRSGLRPYFASSSAARSSASGCARNASHAFGHDASSAPVDG